LASCVLQEAPPVGGLGLLDELGLIALACLNGGLVVVPDHIGCVGCGRGQDKGGVLHDLVDGSPMEDAPVACVPVHLGEQARGLVALGIEDEAFELPVLCPILLELFRH
jgi:hypothetical protein